MAITAPHVIVDSNQGDVAHDAADSGNPIKIGLYAVDPDSPPSAVSSGDRVNALGDLRGRILAYLATALSSSIDSVQANQGPSINAQTNWALCQATRSTTAGTTFAALSMTATAPTASSTRTVITWTGRDNLVLMPFGVGSNNNTFKLRVTGWSTDGTNWFPCTLFDCTCTMSSSLTGVSGQTPSNTDYFCDGITAGSGIGIIQAAPADDTGIAVVVVPVGNYQRVEVQFIVNASATSCDALYTTY